MVLANCRIGFVVLGEVSGIQETGPDQRGDDVLTA